jgi:GPH family glycoside/pentoside/hexuronide:cation symporter
MCVVAGVGVSAAHVLPWAMIPDAIEYGELDTGERHEGVFYSPGDFNGESRILNCYSLTAFVLEFTGYIPTPFHNPNQP